MPFYQGSSAGAKLQAGISQRAVSSQPNLARTHSQDCRTCLGAAIIAKDTVAHSLPLNRKESTTCSHLPGSGQSLWLPGSGKRADTSPTKEFCLNATDEACWGFLTNSLFQEEGNFLWQYSGFGDFLPLLLIACLSFKPAPTVAERTPFSLGWSHHTPQNRQDCSGFVSEGHRLSHTRRGDKSFCPP